MLLNRPRRSLEDHARTFPPERRNLRVTIRLITWARRSRSTQLRRFKTALVYTTLRLTLRSTAKLVRGNRIERVLSAAV